MKKLIIIFSLILFANTLMGQWQWQNTLPQGNQLNGFTFINENIPDHILDIDYRDWEKVEYYISISQNVLNTPAIVSIMMQHEIPVVDTGQIEYFYHKLPQNNSLFYPNNEDILEHGNEYTSMITHGMNYRDYDYVLINEKNIPNFIKLRELKKNYHEIDMLELSMPHTKQKWVVTVWAPDIE